MLAILTRLAYIFSLSNIPLLWDISATPDSNYYHIWAQQIAGGPLSPGQVFFIGPLYAYFLAIFYLIFGASLWVGRLVQAVLAASTVLLLYRTGEKVAGLSAGIIAGLLACLYAPLIYFDGAYVPVTLVNFLITASLYLLCQYEKLIWKGWLGAGVLLGLAAVDRGNLLLVIPFLFIFAKLLFPTVTLPHKIWRSVLILIAGLGLALLPTTIHNMVVEGDFVPTTSQGGLNFYIGNSPQAQGSYYTPAGMKGTPEELNVDDSAIPAEQALGHKLKPSEVSGYWFGQGMDFIVHNFSQIPQLYWRKLVLTLSYLEVPLNESFYFYDENVQLIPGIPILSLFPINLGILLPLSLPGLILLWRGKKGRILVGFFVLYVLSLLPFFINNRYRAPMVLPLFVATGVSLVWLFRRITDLFIPSTASKKSESKPLFLLASVFVVIVGSAWLVNENPSILMSVDNSDLGETRAGYDNMYLHMGLISYDRGNYDDASRFYILALQEKPQVYRSLFGLSLSLLKSKHANDIISHLNQVFPLPREITVLLYGSSVNPSAGDTRYYHDVVLPTCRFLLQKAAEQQPKNPDIYLHLGIIEGDIGLKAESELDLTKSFDLETDKRKASIGKLMLLLDKGEFSEVLEQGTQLQKTYPNDPNILMTMGQASLEMGNYREAENYDRIILSQNPSFPLANYQLGEALRLQNLLTQAEMAYANEQLLHPEAVELMLGRARLAAQKGDKESSAKLYGDYQKQGGREALEGRNSYALKSN